MSRELGGPLREGLRAERQALLERLDRLTDDQLWPADGSWGPGHAVAHIPAMEAWLVSPLEQGRDELAFVDDAIRDEAMAPLVGEPLATLRSVLHERRTRTLALLDRVTDADLARTVDTQWGDRTCLQLLRTVYRHDREHAAQIDDLLAAGAPPPGPAGEPQG